VASYLPFIPPALAAITVEVQSFFHGYDRVGLSLVTLSVVLVVLRQSLTVKDNRELIGRVAAGQAELHRQAFHDALTGLANRALFSDRLEHALDLHRRDMRQLAVVFCDLDDFKLVNDSMGHAVGDELLVRVAERFRATLRPGDTLARLGGDEFAALLEDGGEPIAVADRLRQSLDSAFVVGQRHLLMHASIGIARVAPEDATPTIAEIMANADIAMYRAKANGKNGLCLYTSGMNHNDSVDPELSAALVKAVDAAEILSAYQPIMDLGTGALHGFEALARWQNEGRDIPPSVFIPLAEREGLLSRLTDHMLEQACAQLRVWSAEFSLPNLRMGVNVPPFLLSDPSFPLRVSDVISRNALLPGQLVLEVTEAGFIDDPTLARTICHRLESAGAGLSLDDFGTGYSSLAHLRTIPLRSIKIDKSFVQSEDAGVHGATLLSAVTTLAHQLGLAVIAEGIETETQRQLIDSLGCEYGQGFLFCEPKRPEALVEFLRANVNAGALTTIDSR
jgi:diguanylate cyclase (GGDEF)-like protein